MSFPLDAVRADTPGVSEVVHLNNAGSSLPSRRVLEAVVGHLELEARIGGYEAAHAVADRLERVYRSVAALVGGRPEEVALAESATAAWNAAVHAYPFRDGDRVLTSRAEYAGNAIALLALRDRHGIEVVLIDDDEYGQISLSHLEAELRRGAAMVSLTHVPTGGGLVNPTAEVGVLCRRHDTFYVLDACQSAGQLPLDVAAIGCDVLTATGRKYLRAPRGTGFLWVGRRAMETLRPDRLDQHSASWVAPDRYEMRADARRFEFFEASFAGRLGLGVAVEAALGLGMEAIWGRIRALGNTLREGLREISGVRVQDKGRVLCGIVTFSVDGMSSEGVSTRLRESGINTSVTQPSSAMFDLPERGLGSLVRASVHCFNTADELDRFFEVVEQIAG